MGREPGHGPSNIKDVESEKNCQIARDRVAPARGAVSPTSRDLSAI